MTPPSSPGPAETPITRPTMEAEEVGSRLPMPRVEFVAMMAALMALTALAIDSMLPALQTIGRELGVADPNSRQFVLSAFLGGLAAGALIHGPLSDRYGRRPVMLGALAAYVVFAAACGLAQGFTSLLVFRFLLGFASAAMSVLPISVIRDRYVGDEMAQLVSTIFIVFMIVPIIAPSVGQAILLVAEWRWIFLVLAAMGSVMLLWVWKRLPETLAPEDAVPLEAKRLAREWWQIATHRSATSYMFASALAQSALYGYLNSGPQIFTDVFHAEQLFPLAFAAVALTMAGANFLNSRIVRKYGARRVSQTALIAYIALGLLQVAVAWFAPHSMILFLIAIALNMSMVGLIGSNFGAIAMEPFGHVAGSASSFGSSVRTLVATLIGGWIGYMFNGTAIPMALGFTLCGIAALLLVLWAERGRLFTRPGTARHDLGANPGR